MNRRQHLRTSRRVQVRFWTESDPQPRAGFTTNISPTGMFVGTRNPLSVGTEVALCTLTTPEHEVRARVARSVKVPPALQMVKQPGMGVHFLEKDAGERLAQDLANRTAGKGEMKQGSTARVDTEAAERTPPASTPSSTETDRLVQERRLLQSRVAQLEEKIGALYSDNRSLRRYSDLLENTRTELTAQVASLRTEREKPPEVERPADARAPTGPTAAALEELEKENVQATAANEALRRQVDDLEAALREAITEPADRPESTEDAAAESGRETELTAEIEQLRAHNTELKRQLEAAPVPEPVSEPASPPALPSAGRVRSWGTLAAVALLGFALGFLVRSGDRSMPTAEPMIADEPPGRASSAAMSTVADPVTDGEETAADPSSDIDLPPPPVEPRIAAVTPAIERWAAAWSAQDIDGYLAAYSVDYAPSSGRARDAWAATRRERLTAPSRIEVGIDGLAVEDNGLGRATARFQQSYATPSYRDRVQKTLELAWEEGEWRILSESSEPI